MAGGIPCHQAKLMTLSVSIATDPSDQNIFQPPAMVMSIAITPRNANAPLVIRVIDFKQFDAVTTIKSVYGVGKDWQGDPCGSVAYVWDGLNCTYNGNESPRITTLNLSSSGSSGKIDPSISKLNMLKNLDLSNNRLNGEVPNFLSQLQHLKILNLENNNLIGLVPSALLEKHYYNLKFIEFGPLFQRSRRVEKARERESCSAHDHTGKKPKLQNATNNRALHFLEDLLTIGLQARRRALGVLIPSSSKKTICDVQRSWLLQEPTERFLDFFSPSPEAANPS
ncbi:hypothetical protein VNO77_34194 [Canavalia gladiata]|uniref:Uncharacterized protein n=1 Tax=Canavalia gladiata TaxID=3824 RepID=A0AAN9KG50_CANGL